MLWSGAVKAPLALESAVRDLRPTLVIIDSLRSYNPCFDENPKEAAILLRNFRSITRQFGTTILGVHHIRKPGEGGGMPLENGSVLDWLLQACGPRALINQTDVRLGIDAKPGPSRAVAELNSKSESLQEIGIVVKGFARLRGEFGPYYLGRHLDGEGEPLGYRQVGGPELLFNADQEQCFARLKESSSFKDVHLTYGRGPQATSDFLKKCTAIRILRKIGSGRNIRYVKGKAAE